MEKIVTNGEIIRSMSNEELADFIAEQRFNMAKPVFDMVGFGLEKQVIYAVMLEWIKSPCYQEAENAGD